MPVTLGSLGSIALPVVGKLAESVLSAEAEPTGLAHDVDVVAVERDPARYSVPYVPPKKVDFRKVEPSGLTSVTKPSVASGSVDWPGRGR